MDIGLIMLTVPCKDCEKELKIIGRSEQDCDEKMIKHFYDHDNPTFKKPMSYKKYRKIFLEAYNSKETQTK